MKMRNIILDCDPGHDDAVAIMLLAANNNLNLLGITVESGNQTLEKTGRNALNLAQYLNLDIPVSLGANHPLKRDILICPEIHGESGLDGFIFPPLKKKYDKRDAITLIKDILDEHEKVTLVCTGPLTNIAIFLNTYPKYCDKIEEIVLMGGSVGYGNVTPAAEFNIYCDPEAVDIVFRSGLTIKMMGLDVTRKVKVLPSIIDRISSIDNKVAKLFVSLMKVFNANQKAIFGFDGAPLHDPVTIVYLLDPTCLTMKYMNVEIDISGGPSYGRTNCDQFDYLKKEKNAYVALDIDVDRYFKIIEQSLKSFND